MRHLLCLGIALSSLLAACAVPAEDPAGDESPAREDEALTSCTSLAGTYTLAPAACTGAGTSDPSHQEAYFPSLTPSSGNDTPELWTGHAVKVTQTSCSKVDLEIEVPDVDAFCAKYNAKYTPSPYDYCRIELFDCGYYGDPCPVIDVFKKVTLSLPVGKVKVGNTTRTVALSSTSLSVSDYTPASWTSNSYTPARTDTFTLKKTSTGGLSLGRTGYEAQTCALKP